MEHVDFFKLQAKNLFKDFKTQKKNEDGIYTYSPRFFKSLDRLIVEFDIDENEFTLMSAQHLVAELAGFRKWSDILHASKERLELGKLLLEHYDESTEFGGPILEEWKMYEHVNLEDWNDASKLELFKVVFLNSAII